MNYYLGPYQWIDESWQPPPTTVGSIDLRNLTHMGSKVQDGHGFFATIDSVGGYDLLGQGDLREINSTGKMKSIWNSLLGYNPKGDKLIDLLYNHLTLGSDPTGAIASRPLMPARGNLVIHLGGHSPVKATQFRIGHSPETNQVIAVYQGEYRKIRDLVLDGKLPGNHHRKVLDFWREQYKVNTDIFIPNDLPIELPIRHDTSISENFDGADNAVIGKQLTWVEDSAGTFWDNFNNHGRRISISGTWDQNSVRANSALSSADQQCIIINTVQTNVVETEGGPACRRSSSAITYYFYSLFRSSGSANVRLHKVITGTRTLLAGAVSVTPSIPDTLKIEVLGSSLEGFFNGVSKNTVTDSSIAGNLFCGLMALKNTSDTLEFDTWSAQDIVVPAVGAPASLLMGLL